MTGDERRVRSILADIYTAEGVDIWLNAPNRNLNNATPLQFIRAGDMTRVVEVVEQMSDGMG